MSIEFGEVNKYDQSSQFPAVDLVFTGPKRSLVDRVSGNAAQFTRNTIGTYVDSNGIIQTAAAGEPRYTYDPLTGEELGLLVEESRTNEVAYSTVTSANWTSIDGAAITDNQAIAPDGTNTAALIDFPGTGLPRISIATSIASGTRTVSCWVRAVSGTVTLRIGNGSDFGGNQTVGTEWTRIVEQVPSSSNGAGIYCSNPVSSAEFYAWGYQQEAGSFPTSYIPTSGSTLTRDPDTITFTNNNIYNNSQFDIVNDPFGMSAGSDTLTLLPSASNNSAIKRATIFSSNIAQSKINTFAEKTDEFWRWRVTGDSFGLPNFTTDGQVTVDWGDGTVETLTTSDHTFTDGKTYHEIGFRLDSGTYFRPQIGDNPTNDTKVVALGPAPESMILDADRGFFGCSNLKAFDGTIRATRTLQYAFHVCNSLKNFPFIETSSVDSFFASWDGCSSLTRFPLIDTSSGTNFSFAWRNCTSLTSFPLIDTPLGENFSYAWSGCSSLTSFPLIDTSSGTNFFRSWFGCTSLTSFPLIDTSRGTNFDAAWNSCSSLTSFPLIVTSSVTNFNAAWANCTSLTSFPLIDTSSGTNFQVAWVNCSSLTSFPANMFDSWTATPANSCFVNTWAVCNSLTATSVENILNSIDTSGQSAPASGVDITIDYDASSGTPDVTVSGVDLIRKGWTTTLNGVAKTDPYSFASLDLDFATNLTLNDNISNSNLITFTRDSIGTYVDSNGVIQTAAADTARFDHDPDTLESLGLLLEAEGTNICTQSETFSLTPYTFNNAVTISKNQTDPAGGTNASLITHNAGSAVHRIGEKISTVRCTRSFFVKKVNQRYLYLGDQNGGSFAPNYRFDLDTGTGAVISDINNRNFGFDIIPFPNGYYRINVDCSSGDIFTIVASNTFSSTGSNPAIFNQPETSDGTEQFIIWGYQVESSTYPTSYIPTSGSTLTRAADVASITGTNFSSWYEQSEGTIYVDFDKATTQRQNPFAISDGTSTNRMSVYYQDNLAVSYIASSAGGFDQSVYTTSFPLSSKYILGYSSGNTRPAINGNLGTVITESNLPINTTMFFGRRDEGDILYMLTGHISHLTYWPKRLTDTSLQYLTQ